MENLKAWFGILSHRLKMHYVKTNYFLDGGVIYDCKTCGISIGE